MQKKENRKNLTAQPCKTDELKKRYQKKTYKETLENKLNLKNLINKLS